jgi:putative membrane protein
MTLSDDDRKTLNAAVTMAESSTSAEVVVVVRARSGAYADVTLAGGMFLGLVGLATVLFLDLEFAPFEVVPAVALATLLGAVLAQRLGPTLVSSKRRHAQVDEAALASFARCGVHRTKGRTGLLLYLSTGEGLARVLPDQGVIDAVPQSVRGEFRAALATVARAPHVEALARAVEAIGTRLGVYLPRAEDDVDELQGLPPEQSAVELS